jgi:hypothetical protein
MSARRVLALLTVMIVAGLALPVLAASTTAPADSTATTAAPGETATTGATATTGEPVVPAVSVEVTQPAEVQADWTYRYFIPTLLVLAAAVVIMTVIRYFTRVVRNRYRVVR